MRYVVRARRSSRRTVQCLATLLEAIVDHLATLLLVHRGIGSRSEQREGVVALVTRQCKVSSKCKLDY